MIKKVAAALILALSLSSCAPMPGPALFNGLTHSTPLEQVDVTVTEGLWVTTKYCNSRVPWHQVLLNCIGNACIWTGCASVWWDADGNVTKCDVYVAGRGGMLEEHELKHCEGYADKLY